MQTTRPPSLGLGTFPIGGGASKWVLFNSGATMAKHSLGVPQRAPELNIATEADLADAALLATSLHDWGGTLEDASVAALALRLGLPIWTLNSRDFTAFPRLSFWTPPVA